MGSLKYFVLIPSVILAPPTINYELNPCGNKMLDLIHKVEGWEERSYLDVIGIETIGYGFTKSFLKMFGMTFDDITKDNSDLVIIKYCENINSKYLNNTYLNVKQKISTFSLTYNIGETKFNKSTLYSKSKKSIMTNEQVCHQLKRFVYASGNRIKGLENRRKLECEAMN